LGPYGVVAASPALQLNLYLNERLCAFENEMHRAVGNPGRGLAFP
jgi:hypothetical protein